MNIIAAATALFAAGCSHHNGWTLNGTAPEDTHQVYIEAPDAMGVWQIVDSVMPQNGEYTFEMPKAKDSIYRISIGNSTYYVPADSTETIILSFDGNRGGSEEAILFNQVDAAIASGQSLFEVLENNFATKAAYYAALSSGNYSLLRTVAQYHSTELPGSNRTSLLLAREKAEREKRIKERREASGNTEQLQTVIYAPEISYFEIERMNPSGELKRLSDVVNLNKIVVLAFSDFERPDNSNLTMILGDLHKQGIGIFQVGFDRNSQLWADRATDLPWTCVYQSESDSKTPIMSYMVSELPTVFIIKNGEIVERVTDYMNLSTSVQKYL